MPLLSIPRLSVAPSVRTAARQAGDDHDRDERYRDRLAELNDQGLPMWVEELLADVREESPRPAGFVPSTHLWWMEGDEYLGRVNIRHRLTPALRRVGGHIGYRVVPSHRRQGHARAMLAAALPVASALGLERVLLTCDAENLASRRVIESNGGLCDTDRDGVLHYWLPTHS